MGEPPVISRGDALTRIRGWFFAAVMLTSSFLGCLYVLAPLIPLLYLNPRLYRRLVDRLVGFWLVFPGGLMEHYFGATVHISGDRIASHQPALIIMNHRTRLDWLYFWPALFKIDPKLLTTEKISLKAMLKYLPGAGWAMSSNAFLFLDRVFESDRTRLDRMLTYYARSGRTYQLLLFPEGTDKCPLATERSRKHAVAKGLTHYDHVLHPRTTGFVHIVQEMRRLNYLQAVYNVTVGYADCIVQSEFDFVAQGVAPKEVHFQVERIDASSLPTEDDDLATWLTERWQEKEEQLHTFYTSDDGTKRMRFPLQSGQVFEPDTWNRTLEWTIILVWSGLTIFWAWFWWTASYQGYWTLFCMAIWFGAQRVDGGIEWTAVRAAAATE